MSNFKHMKIRTATSEQVHEVQRALYTLGYSWMSTVPDNNYIKFVDDCYGIETYEDDGCITRWSCCKSVATDFKNDTTEEYFLVNGEFVTKDYWTQPVTIKIHGPESEQFKKAQKEVYDRQTSYTETTYEPLPFHLKPRSEFLHERNVDIINVMLEYVTEGKRIPDDMISELTTNNAEIYNV